MEQSKLKAYQKTIEIVEKASDPRQVELVNDLAELLAADPETAMKFIGYQLTHCSAALLRMGALQDGSVLFDGDDETEH